MSETDFTSTRGRLLVATPLLTDPNFHRTVVLMVEHTTMGAIGVVLNRPGDVAVREVLPAWERLAGIDTPISVGGPVEPEAMLAVARRRSTGADHGVPLTASIELVDLEADPAVIGDDELTVQIFRGYAGWGPDQLELELSEGAWWVFDTAPTDVAPRDPAELWRTVVARQRGRVSWLATFPDDPSMN